MTEDGQTNEIIKLDVGDGHKLHVVDWGNKDSELPFIFLHGGPGSQVKDKHKAVFNPEIHRVIFFDQRGAGESTPQGSLKNNTTSELIDDISAIADNFEIKQFRLHGYSWGSTLALAYAIENPDRVKEMVVGGVFTATTQETNWINQGRFRTFYPEVWQSYLDKTPKEYIDNPSAYHFDKAINGTKEEQKYSAYIHGSLEGGVVKLDDRFTAIDYEEYDPAGTRIEIHYMSNRCFIPEGHILNNVDKLTMPIHIVHGRYDMVTPPQTAYELHQQLPNSKIYWTLSGHLTEHEDYNTVKAIINGFNS